MVTRSWFCRFENNTLPLPQIRKPSFFWLLFISLCSQIRCCLWSLQFLISSPSATLKDFVIPIEIKIICWIGNALWSLQWIKYVNLCKCSSECRCLHWKHAYLKSCMSFILAFFYMQSLFFLNMCLNIWEEFLQETFEAKWIKPGFFINIHGFIENLITELLFSLEVLCFLPHSPFFSPLCFISLL